jgi:hypothetical protein
MRICLLFIILFQISCTRKDENSKQVEKKSESISRPEDISKNEELLSGFDHCRQRAINQDSPHYINVCKSSLGQMRLFDYLSYLDNDQANRADFDVFDESEFLPEEDYPSRPAVVSPAELSKSLRQVAKLGRVTDLKNLPSEKKEETATDSTNERIRQINEARERLLQERKSAIRIEDLRQLRALLRDSNPIVRVGAISLMKAQSSSKKFSGDFGRVLSALREKFKSFRVQDIKSYKMVGSSSLSLLRAEREFKKGDEKFALDLLRLSESLLDVGIGISAGSNLVKDTYELIFGTNMETGEELSSEDRGISLVRIGREFSSSDTKGDLASKLSDHFGEVSARFLGTPGEVFKD